MLIIELIVASIPKKNIDFPDIDRFSFIVETNKSRLQAINLCVAIINAM